MNKDENKKKTKSKTKYFGYKESETKYNQTIKSDEPKNWIGQRFGEG